MKITFPVEEAKIEFKSLTVSDVFEYDSKVYMKVDPFDYCGSDYNAIQLSTGKFRYISVTANVVPYKAELILK